MEGGAGVRERRKRLEAEGKISKLKIQMTNGDELVGCISLIGFIG